MRRAAVVLAALVLTGVAAGAVADRSVVSPGGVQGLARSSLSVAFLSGPYKGHCGPRVYLWNLASNRVIGLGKHADDVCSQEPVGGSGVSSVAVAGNRAVWLEWAGNLTDYVLQTATTTKLSEQMLEFEEVDPDAAVPIVLGTASDTVIPYAVNKTVKVLGVNGKQFYSWHAPARVTNLTAYQGQVAVFMAGGRRVVLSPTGAVQSSYQFKAGGVQEFALSGQGLVVQLPGGKVEIRKGAQILKLRILPATAHMLDYAQGIVLYAKGRAIHGLRMSDGKDALLAHAEFAVLELNGLSYAYGTKVSSVPWVKIIAAFH